MSWLEDDVLAIVYECGLVEVLESESRSLLASRKFDKQITGVCGKVIDEYTELYILFKGGDLACMHVRDGVWMTIWSVSCGTAISFAKPILLNKDGVIVHVRSGQHVVAFTRVADGKSVAELDIGTLVDAKGIITGSCVRESTVALLTESGLIVEVDGAEGVQRMSRVVFPVDPQNESVIPTAIESMTDGTLAVGFSNGLVSSASGEKVYLSTKGGIGCIRNLPQSSTVVVGTWKGNLFCVANETALDLQSPHACNVCQVAVSPSGGRMAVASTDGRVSVWNLS